MHRPLRQRAALLRRVPDLRHRNRNRRLPLPQPVDVEAVLKRMAADNKQQLNWQTSIVDLMKLLGMDSSLENRKELARELGYTGDTGDSAAMNIWLHKRVMKELAAHGGKVPANMLD